MRRVRARGHVRLDGRPRGGIIIIPVLSQVLGYDLRATIAASLIGVIAGSIAASPWFLRRASSTAASRSRCSRDGRGWPHRGPDRELPRRAVVGVPVRHALAVVAVHMLREFRRPAGGVPGPGAVVATPGPDPTDVAGPVRAPSSFDAHYSSRARAS
ncbi:MAG: hypothetical protein R3C32_00990 [Chloroflexota bacterium]